MIPANKILSDQTQRIASVKPSLFLSRLAKVTVVATFILLIAGAIVTGNKAALSDPTWPKFVGHWFPRYWVGGLKYEDSHRLIAAVVGILTFLLAVVTQLKDVRSKIRKLGWFAFALVVAQAIIGGMIIHTVRDPLVSMAHGVVAQAFFCTVLAIAVYTSPRWARDLELPSVHRTENASYLGLCKVVTGLVFLQVVLGAGVRHSQDAFLMYLLAHIGTAFIVLFAVIWFAMRTFGVYRDVATLRKTVIGLLVLLGFQVLFGILSIFANIARREPEMAHWWDVFVSTAHVGGGALILALLFTTVLRARRLLIIDTPAPDLKTPAETIV